MFMQHDVNASPNSAVSLRRRLSIIMKTAAMFCPPGTRPAPSPLPTSLPPPSPVCGKSFWSCNCQFRQFRFNLQLRSVWFALLYLLTPLKSQPTGVSFRLVFHGRESERDWRVGDRVSANYSLRVQLACFMNARPAQLLRVQLGDSWSVRCESCG